MKVFCIFVAVCGVLAEANSNTKGAFEQILEVNLGKGWSVIFCTAICKINQIIATTYKKR